MMAETGREKRSRRGARGLRYGGLSVAITISFITVIVLLNAVVTTLGERYSLRIDLSQDKIFQLSRESERFLAGMEQDVTLYILTSEDYFSSGNLYYIQAHEVLRQYAARTPHIKLNYIDLARSPGFETRFPQFRLSSYTIILASGDRASTVQINDLFNTEYDPYYNTEYITSSKAEQVLTSAMMNLTIERQVTVVMLEGFGETGAEDLKNALVTNSYRVIHQNILTGEIDQEADVAVICAPMRDYTDDELRKLDRFLINNNDYGKSLLYFPSVLQPPTPNLNAFLADWGVSVGDGIVFQTDYSRLVTMSNFWSAADYTEDIYAKPVIERRLLTVVPEARPLSILFESRENITVSAPLSFTEKAVVSPIDPEEGWNPEMAEVSGPFPAFTISTVSAYSSNLYKHVDSYVLVFGSYEIIGRSLMSSRTVGNQDYMLNVFAVITDRQETVFIAPKTIGAQELPITGNYIIIIGVIFVAVLPVCVLIAGGFTFLRRRHL